MRRNKLLISRRKITNVIQSTWTLEWLIRPIRTRVVSTLLTLILPQGTLMSITLLPTHIIIMRIPTRRHTHMLFLPILLLIPHHLHNLTIWAILG